MEPERCPCNCHASHALAEPLAPEEIDAIDAQLEQLSDAHERATLKPEAERC